MDPTRGGVGKGPANPGSGRVWRCVLLGLGVALAGVVCAQPAATPTGAERPAGAAPTAALPTGEAREARIQELIRIRDRLQSSSDRAPRTTALRELVMLLEGDPRWGAQAFSLGVTLYGFYSQREGIDLHERVLAHDGVDPATRARTAIELVFEYANTDEIAIAARLLGRAESLVGALRPSAGNELAAALDGRIAWAKTQLYRMQGRHGEAIEAGRSAVRWRDDAMAQIAARGTTGWDEIDVQRFRDDSARGLLLYAYLGAGRVHEALTMAEQGLSQARLERAPINTQILWMMRLVSACLAAERFDQAERWIAEARGLQARMGADARGNIITTLLTDELSLLMLRGRWQQADARYRELLAATRGDPIAYARVNNSRVSALLAAKNGRLDEAFATIDGSVRFRTRLYGPRHPTTQQARGVRGLVLLMKGDVGGALADYDELFKGLLDSPTGWIDVDAVGRRNVVGNIVIGEYVRHSAALAGDPARAGELERLLPRLVQLLDRTATGVTQQAIIDSSARLVARTPELRALIDEEQTQRGALRPIYRDIAEILMVDLRKLEDAPRRAMTTRLGELRRRAEEGERRLAAQRDKLSDQFPSYARLIQPPVPAPERIASALRRDERFLSVHPMEAMTLVWLVGGGEVRLHRSALTAAEIGAAVDALRAATDPTRIASGGAPAFDPAQAHRLYRELIAPFASRLEGARALVMSAQGALASLPPGLLLAEPTAPGAWSGAAWLARRFDLVQVPSAAAFVLLRESRSEPAGLPFIGYGDPQFGAPEASRPAAPRGWRNLVLGAASAGAAAFDPGGGFRYQAMPPLPDTRDELTAVNAALKGRADRDLHFGPQASRRAVLETPMADRRVVAFATHGLLPGDLPGLSRPALALAAAPPGESPLLELDDILTLRLNAQLVLLSACNTAGGERAGAAMSGLVRGFFHAGGRSVLATHWAVDSESARALVTRAFSLIGQGEAPAAALRAAQTAMIEGRLGPPEYAHPIHWAPYTLFGETRP